LAEGGCHSTRAADLAHGRHTSPIISTGAGGGGDVAGPPGRGGSWLTLAGLPASPNGNTLRGRGAALILARAETTFGRTILNRLARARRKIELLSGIAGSRDTCAAAENEASITLARSVEAYCIFRARIATETAVLLGALHARTIAEESPRGTLTRGARALVHAYLRWRTARPKTSSRARCTSVSTGFSTEAQSN